MVVVNGFTRTPLSLTYVSPYKSVLEAGTKRGMFNLTEQEIHENFTIPTVEGYAEVLGIDVEVTPWSDDRVITIRIIPTPEYKALQARRSD
jgi:putative NADH-flavin reductase